MTKSTDIDINAYLNACNNLIDELYGEKDVEKETIDEKIEKLTQRIDNMESMIIKNEFVDEYYKEKILEKVEIIKEMIEKKMSKEELFVLPDHIFVESIIDSIKNNNSISDRNFLDLNKIYKKYKK